jgi:glycosyltransferase involved in cell wall biosynthesis
MRVAAVTYTESLSGAGIAALRVHRALRSEGIDSELMVLRKRTSADDVQTIGGAWTRRAQAMRCRTTQAILRALGGDPDVALSANLFPTGLHRRLNAVDADVLHLHWVGAEMIRIEELTLLNKPLVWTLHDEWLSEGMAHYGELEHGVVTDSHPRAAFRRLDRHVRARKATALARMQPFIATPSHWLAERTRQSGLIDCEHIRVIPNPVPTEIYRPTDRSIARERLGLPENGRVIGFGAVSAMADPRKGYSMLKSALYALSNRQDKDLSLLVFGAEREGNDFPIPTRFAGVVTNDDDIAMLYAAMDVFVCPSMQENLPNTIAEAMGCGVPCVAFAVGGIPDLIEHNRSGYLATPFDAMDLSHGILACIAQTDEYGYAARQFVEQNLAPALIASRYSAIYEDALRAA